MMYHAPENKGALRQQSPFHHHSPDTGAIVPELTAADKRVNTAIARLAMKGHAVHRLAHGGFLVTRWTLTRECVDIDALEAFLGQIGAAE